MSPEAIREAVAVSLGWSKVAVIYDHQGIKDLFGKGPDGWMRYVPDYPGDIKAAWGLLEELKKEGWGWDLHSPSTQSFNYGVYVWWPDDSDHFAVCDSMPLAICEAYLKTKGLWKEDK